VATEPDFCLADLIRAGARRAPERRCLTFGDRTLSFAELDRRSSQVANALRGSGLSTGDRVAIVARNDPAFYELAFACAKSGTVLVPINWRLSAREIADILEDAQPALIVVGAEFLPLLAAERAERSVTIESGYIAWRDNAAAEDPSAPGANDSTLALLYTSGTTGRPKGVRISHRNLWYSVRMAREVWSFTERSVNLVAMPLFHIGGLGYGMMALSQGGHTVVLQHPTPGDILDALVRHRVSHAFFVPTLIQTLLDTPGVAALDLTSLERIVYGASPISGTLLQRAIDVFRCGFSHAYGLTETAGTVTTLRPEEHEAQGPNAGRLRSCGRPVPWVELGLFDPVSGSPVAAGTIGEIWIRSPMTTAGYWNKPAETAALIRPDGWLRTGDAATRDAEGFVYICDRYKDMIISGSENVFPAEVENVLARHPGVVEAAVIGVPHARWGETVKAVVVLKPGAQAGSADIIEFCRASLARYKCPTVVDFVAALPKSASGKVLRRELRENHS
jgi:acyl-CoA synthetase (AMP-forming)/AMP-acid ligase II